MRWLVSSTVAYVVGLLYPAYATYKAVKQAEAHRRADPAWAAEATSASSSSSASSAEAGVLRRRRVDVDALMTQWLMYWIVMAVFTVAEVLCETFLLAGLWFPFYHELKVLFILWLTLPQFRGATKIYKRFLAPTLDTYESEIDGHLDVARARVQKEMGRGIGAAGEFVRKRGSSIFNATRDLVASSMSSEADSSSGGGGAAAAAAGVSSSSSSGPGPKDL